MEQTQAVPLRKDTFEAAVLSAPAAVVDFWASWCGPCRAIAPVVDQLAEQYSGRIFVGKVNVDEEMDLAQKYAVSTIPTLVFFQKGQVVRTLVGVRPQEDYQKAADTLLSSSSPVLS